MPVPKITILGVHQLEVTPMLVSATLEQQFGSALEGDALKSAEWQVRQELSSVYLFEMLVKNPNELFDIGRISQDDPIHSNSQVPWLEVLLADDGSDSVPIRSIQHHIRTTRPTCARIAFYLHFVDDNQPLNTPYGVIPFPPASPMPDRLWTINPYVPVD